MRILIVDCNILPEYWGASDLVRFGHLAADAIVHVRRAPHEDLPDLSSVRSRYDRVVISGSMTSILEEKPWISRFQEWIRQLMDRKIPLFGICYGHQIIIKILGEKTCVRRADQPEFGWSRIEVLHPSPLFKGLPKVFYSFSSHYDEVCQLPPGVIHLANSKDCAIQAFHVDGKPIFGVQFHPERDLQGAKESVSEMKKKIRRENFLNLDSGSRLYDPEISKTIFRNFFEL